MSLWFDLNINDQRIGDVDIQRVEPLDVSDPVAIADVVSAYTVRRNGVPIGTVHHRYGDGAWRLLVLAANCIDIHDAAMRHP
jgi:hypothetical protein